MPEHDHGALVRGECGDGRREAIGVEDADESLLSLPTRGALIVNATSGPWIVRGDGTRRLLGPYDQASWSPRGLFVVVSRGHELTALTPLGKERWTHPAHGLVNAARWAPSGFRIAYQVGSTLRVIAGDSTGDRLLARNVLQIAPAWRPGPAHVLAYAKRDRRLVVADVDTRRRLWTARLPAQPHQVLWAPDGSRLLVLAEKTYVIYASDGRVVARRTFRTGAPQLAVFAPRGHRFALVVGLPGRSELRVGSRIVFRGAGAFNDAEWSPDGRWLLVSWGTANQWVFIRSAGVRRIAAVSNVARQFRSENVPALGGWCCP